MCTLEDLYKGRVKKVTVSAAVMDMWSGMPQTKDKTFSVSIAKGWKQGTKIKYGPSAVRQTTHPLPTHISSCPGWC